MVGRTLTIPGLLVSSVLFSLGFILHELAHKYVAQGYGLWAEFRVNKMGLVLTAISVISPFKLIAPGAVVIAGYADKDRIGRTAFAGPLVNIVIAGGLLVALPILSTGWLHDSVLAGTAINAFLALINLIPFTILDGQKVFAWNRTYWVVLMAISLALTIYTNFVL
jgi:Zn-dependent protease